VELQLRKEVIIIFWLIGLRIILKTVIDKYGPLVE
jgi:hypothetical protein